jgi:hypothetical protein
VDVVPAVGVELGLVEVEVGVLVAFVSLERGDHAAVSAEATSAAGAEFVARLAGEFTVSHVWVPGWFGRCQNGSSQGIEPRRLRIILPAGNDELLEE